MCLPLAAGPLAALQFGLGVVSTGASLIGQMQAQKAQNAMYEQNAKNATRNALNQYESVQRKMTQERAAALQDKQETALKATQARSTAVTAAGEANVSGLSLDALLGEYYAKQGRYNDSVDANLEATQQYLRGEMESVQTGAQNQINSVQRGTPPNFLAAGIQLFGTGMDSLRLYNTQKAQGYA
jgi:hypothetical protein